MRSVLIVEDHAPMRAALADLLRTYFPASLVREAASVASALDLCHAEAPELVLLDVALPDGNGIALIPALRALAPGCRIVVVSQHGAAAYSERALAAGACAYVTKDNLRRQLIPAIDRAFQRAR